MTGAYGTHSLFGEKAFQTLEIRGRVNVKIARHRVELFVSGTERSPQVLSNLKKKKKR